MDNRIEMFADIEAELVSELRGALQRNADPVTNNVRVATRLVEPQLPQPEKQVIIASDGGPNTNNNLLRQVTVRVLVFAPTDEEATDLARWVEALLRHLRLRPNNIFNIEIQSSASKVEEPTGQELRLITATVLTKAKIITL